MTEDPAVRKYPGVVNPQIVQRYLMAHHGTATVYLSYRAQGGGRAGLSGVRQVLDVTGAKADDFPRSAGPRPEDVPHLLFPESGTFRGRRAANTGSIPRGVSNWGRPHPDVRVRTTDASQ